MAIIVGDALSMSLGDYLSSKAEIEYAQHEQSREFYEIEHTLNEEIKEIVEIYGEKGFSVDDSVRLA